MKSSYIRGFDGLRAVSIVFVVLTHLGVYSMMPPGILSSSRFTMLVNGTTGVNFFFAISGFLITTILLKEKQTTGKIHFKNFFIRRFLRLLPTLLVFYLTILILMELLLLSGRKS
jgi:peptidoglycan/LPS O-acetylase OafA/YrhL